MSDEVSSETKRAIAGQELQMWRNTLYQLTLRHRVNKKIGTETDTLKKIEDEMIKCEGAIDALKEELASLSKETK